MDNAKTRRQRFLDCYRNVGRPTATIFLPARSDVEDAAKRFDIRTKNAISELTELGADAELLAIVETALDDFDHSSGAALALVANGDGVVLAEPMFRPVDRLFVSLAPTPALLPLLAATQGDIAHAAVLIDREGADIWYRDDLGGAVEVESVTGDTEHIHRGHPGGWSQRRFQQVAENTWERNAATVVDTVVESAKGDDIDIEVIVVGGDVRAVGFFTDHVPEHLGEVIIIDGSRAAGAEAFLDNADVAIRTVAAGRMADTIEEMKDARATDQTVSGLEALELAGQGRIERLYIANDAASPDRWHASFDFAVPVLSPSSSNQGTLCPGTDGAVALGVATGAEIVVVTPAALQQPVRGVVRGG